MNPITVKSSTFDPISKCLSLDCPPQISNTYLHFGTFIIIVSGFISPRICTMNPAASIAIMSIGNSISNVWNSLISSFGKINNISLLTNSGMLFIFPNEDIREFHTLDMEFPIDIIAIDAAGFIVHILGDINPETIMINVPKCKYVLEICGGQSRDKHLEIGSKVDDLTVIGFIYDENFFQKSYDLKCCEKDC